MTKTAASRASAGDEGGPPPPGRARRVRLNTLDEVRVEMGYMYRAMAARKLSVKEGYTLIMALAQIGRMTEATAIEERLAAIERRLRGE